MAVVLMGGLFLGTERRERGGGGEEEEGRLPLPLFMPCPPSCRGLDPVLRRVILGVLSPLYRQQPLYIPQSTSDTTAQHTAQQAKQHERSS